MKFIIQKNKPGFTIVEIIIVTIVITILAAIVIVGYGSWRTSIAKQDVKSDLSLLATAMESARNTNNAYPTSIPSSFKASSDTSVVYKSGTATTYCIEASSIKNPSIVFNIKDTTQTPVAGTCISCNSGDSLSGSTCTHTYTAYYSPATSGYYYCSFGDTLSGTTCTSSGNYAASYQSGTSGYYYCPNTANNEVLVGTNCVGSSTYAATYGLICSSGGTLSGFTCTLTTVTNTKIGCPSGYSITGSGSPLPDSITCTKTYSATAAYTCPSGGTLSGTTCTISSSYAAVWQAGTSGYYYCPSGGSLSGTTCYTSGSYAAYYSAPTGAYYYCDSGDGSPLGSTCTHTYPAS